MSRVITIALGSVCFAVAVFAAPQARAIELITNGGFELPAPNGSLNGWLTAQRPTSVGSFIVDAPGTETPGPTSFRYPTAANLLPGGGGTAYALSLPVGPMRPGSATNVLYQDVVVPSGILGATLRFQMFVNDPNNQGAAVVRDANNNPILDHRGLADVNQFAIVDLMRGGTDIFSTRAADRVTVEPLYLNVDSSMGNTSPWVQYSFNLLPQVQAGGNFRVRFATTNNESVILMGVDNVSFDVTPANVPEGSTALLILTAGLLVRRRGK